MVLWKQATGTGVGSPGGPVPSCVCEALQRCQIGVGGVQPFLWEGSRSEYV